MPEINESIDQLQTRLEKLIESQEHFRREISQIRYEINVLRNVQQKRENLAQAAQPSKQKRKKFLKYQIMFRQKNLLRILTVSRNKITKQITRPIIQDKKH